MELTTKHEANDVRHAVALDATAKPVVLQACYPSDRCRLVLQIRQSFPVRIYDSSFCTASNYKTLMISQWTTCAEAIKMVMKSRYTPLSSPSFSRDHSDEETDSHRRDASDVCIMLLDMRTRKETMVHPEERLFTALYESSGSGQYQLHLRPLHRSRHYESCSQLMPESAEDDPVPTEYYRRRKITPTPVPLYADDDFSSSSLVSRFRDHVI